ncbi:type II toxin-antitoxin system RelE/ParE family toxin [Xenorhabdus sp. Vera]|uniref:type II toxin-antitoxin system RelE/ParE family toxin n=1 Tax=Xenorhabdus koppenhoeferi TaxID=351659 RepID=UPI0019C0ECFD|nr:type II toxin-antitoxin system RelE/ParE family toxin [Xenorhabdus sp. Vera]MBD2812499.1 type II toxin-antitoxin system RelE/ParE family toxin [Xenorhabdus sp. Vera]
MITISWEETAQTDREQIYLYFFEQAGLLLADEIDAKFVEMSELLKVTPYAGVKARNSPDERYRKLVVPRFPFVMLYRYDKEIENIKILRILHIARKITGLF